MGGAQAGRGMGGCLPILFTDYWVIILVCSCFFFIGSVEVGIFRLPGQTSRVQSLKDQYDQGQLLVMALPTLPVLLSFLFKSLVAC